MKVMRKLQVRQFLVIGSSNLEELGTTPPAHDESLRQHEGGPGHGSPALVPVQAMAWADEETVCTTIRSANTRQMPTEQLLRRSADKAFRTSMRNVDL
eukprot:gene18336-24800_t